MRKINTFLVLIGLIIAGCASQPTAPAPEKIDIHVFYETPKVDYTELGSVGKTQRAEHPMEVLEQILLSAAELGADGVIVHSIRNRGTVAGLGDTFGTGGGAGHAVYQIRATAIQYVE